MSNTGRSKKLASFNCDEDLWSQFRHRCQEQGTTATATLTSFIQRYLDGSLDDLDVNPLDKRFGKQVRASVDNYLATRLDSLHTLVTALSEKVAFLETQLPRSNKKAAMQGSAPRKAIALKEPEFWFIQQRVKHLGLEISANQRMKIEMWANESYRERHGQIPKKQPFHGTQVSAYPTADLDILDATIKGVVAQGHS